MGLVQMGLNGPQDPHALLGHGVGHTTWLGLEEVASAVEAVKVLPVLPHQLVAGVPTLCADIRTLIFSGTVCGAPSSDCVQEIFLQPGFCG